MFAGFTALSALAIFASAQPQPPAGNPADFTTAPNCSSLNGLVVSQGDPVSLNLTGGRAPFFVSAVKPDSPESVLQQIRTSTTDESFDWWCELDRNTQFVFRVVDSNGNVCFSQKYHVGKPKNTDVPPSDSEYLSCDFSNLNLTSGEAVELGWQGPSVYELRALNTFLVPVTTIADGSTSQKSVTWVVNFPPNASIYLEVTDGSGGCRTASPLSVE